MKYLDFDTNERIVVDLKASNVGFAETITLGKTVYDFELADGFWLNAVVVTGVRKDGLEVASISIQYDDIETLEVYYDTDNTAIIFFNDIQRLRENVFMKGLEYREEIKCLWGLLDDLHNVEMNNPDNERILDDVEEEKGRIYRTLGRLEKQFEKVLKMAKGTMLLIELPTAVEVFKTHYNVQWHR